MEDFEKQLAETTDPFERVKLIADSSLSLVKTNFDRAVELVDEALPIGRKRMKRGEGRIEYALLVRAFGYLCYSRGEFEKDVEVLMKK
jgi:hypothetical protein